VIIVEFFKRDSQTNAETGVGSVVQVLTAGLSGISRSELDQIRSDALASANSAAAEALAASNYASSASSSNTSAQAYSLAAAAEADDAAASAASALASANTANTKATIATNQATIATDAATTATNATNSVVLISNNIDSVALAVDADAASAASSASSALSSKTAAAASAGTATSQANIATTKATEASASATSALASANSAAADKVAAADSAIAAASSASSANTNIDTIIAAKDSAEAAALSAENSDTSAQQAATNSANSATAASTSATSANSAASIASSSATSVLSVEANIQGLVDETATNALAAATSATTATSKATSATNSATSATNSAANASASAISASTDAVRAKNEADRAQSIADSMGGTGGGTWGGIVGTLSDQADLQLVLDGKLDAAANAVSATKLTTARTISFTGDATGSTTFDGTANKAVALTVAKAAKWTTARTLSVTGDATGSVIIDGSGNMSLALTVGGLSASIPFSQITSKPTTLAGYGITDAATSGHTHTFASITSKPTTLAGYGITDAATSSHTHSPTQVGLGNVVNVLQYSASNTNIGTGATNYAAGNHDHSSISGTSGSSLYLVRQDTRTENLPPSGYSDSGVGYHFKQNTADGFTAGGGTYHRVLNLDAWGGISGGLSGQLAFGDNGVVGYRGSVSEATWSGWKTFVFTGENIGGGASNYAAGNHSHSQYVLNNGYDEVQELTFQGGISDPNFTNNDSSCWNNNGTVPFKIVRGNNAAAIWLKNGDVSNSRELNIQCGHSSTGYAYIGGIINLNPNGGTVMANGNPLYHAGYNNIGSGATNYAAGNHGHLNQYIGSQYANGYAGILGQDNSNATWVRTTTLGILPYQAGGYSSIGTTTWPFSAIYSTNFYGTFKGHADTATWADTVDVNSNNLSAYWYDVVWHSGDTVYSSANVEIQGSTGTLRAARLQVGTATGYFYGDANYTQFTGGNMYFNTGVGIFYNYAGTTYHGNTSGCDQNFRGNNLYGNSWNILASGAINVAGGTVAQNGYLEFAGNSTWGGILRVGGNGRTITTALGSSIASTNGNLHIDCGTTGTLHLNYYSGNGGIIFGNGANGNVGNLSSSGSLTLSGAITVAGNVNSNGDTYYGDGKGVIQFSDSWLRINPLNAFSSGIYCGSSVLRTDGQLEVGSNGGSFKVTSTGTVSMAGDLTVGSGTASNIYMTDTDNTTRRIHCNSNRIGFLNSSSGWSAWSDNTGNWVCAYTVYGADCISTSDIRVKSNLELIQNARWMVNQLDGWTFDRSDMDGRRHGGVIAQKVEEVYPVAIFKTEDEVLGEKLNVSSTALIGLLVAAFKEQDAVITKQQAEIDSIKQMLLDLNIGR